MNRLLLGNSALGHGFKHSHDSQAGLTLWVCQHTDDIIQVIHICDQYGSPARGTLCANTSVLGVAKVIPA